MSLGINYQVSDDDKSLEKLGTYTLIKASKKLQKYYNEIGTINENDELVAREIRVFHQDLDQTDYYEGQNQHKCFTKDACYADVETNIADDYELLHDKSTKYLGVMRPDWDTINRGEYHVFEKTSEISGVTKREYYSVDWEQLKFTLYVLKSLDKNTKKHVKYHPYGFHFAKLDENSFVIKQCLDHKDDPHLPFN